MRTTLLSSIFILAAAAMPALADNVPQLDTSALPTSCQWTGDPQAKGQPAPLQLAAIASAADCMAAAKLDGLSITPTPEGARAIDTAIAPSLAMLDRVMQSSDLEARLVAAHAKADLLAGAAVKLTSSVHPVGTMLGHDLATFNAQVDQANELAAPFRDRSATAFRQLSSLTQTDAARGLAAHDPVVAFVVSDAQVQASQISRR